MKRHLTISLAAVILAALAGYWLGFRHAWGMGLMADYAPRGVIALGHTRLLESGRTAELRFALESEIDSGLMWWYHLDRSSLRSFLNVLSGTDVIPDYEQYVRKLARHRKSNPSPLEDAEFNERMLESIEKKDPAFAEMISEGGREQQRILKQVVDQYGR